MVFLFSSFPKSTSEEMLDMWMDWTLVENLKQLYSQGKHVSEDGRAAMCPPLPTYCSETVLWLC